MKPKNKALNAELTELSQDTADKPTANVIVPKKNDKKANKNKPNKQGEKKENFFIRIPKRIGRAFVGMWQELKNVSWPTFRKALASTGVVVGVVCIFFLVLLAFDSALGGLFGLVIGK